MGGRVCEGLGFGKSWGVQRSQYIYDKKLCRRNAQRGLQRVFHSSGEHVFLQGCSEKPVNIWIAHLRILCKNYCFLTWHCSYRVNCTVPWGHRRVRHDHWAFPPCSTQIQQLAYVECVLNGVQLYIWSWCIGIPYVCYMVLVMWFSCCHVWLLQSMDHLSLRQAPQRLWSDQFGHPETLFLPWNGNRGLEG